MCGLVSFVGFRGAVAPERVESALAALGHRGPDGRGRWRSSDGRVALGHNRLAIRGGASGAQPLISEDGQLVVVVSGELYPYRRLRAELEQSGHRFRTDSDSELVLHLYREHGLGFVEHLRGEFAFVLWDAREQRLIAVRDQFGVRPLCYAHDASGVAIASEAKALLAAGHPRRWDEAALQHALRLQYLLPDQTVVEGVAQVPPGHALVVERSEVRLWRYFRLAELMADGPEDEGDDWAAELRARLRAAVETRLDSDAPVAFGLSGGIDSSSVVALAQDLMGRPPSCFSVFFPGADHDESEVIGELEATRGLDLHPVRVSDEDFVARFPEAAFHCETFAVNAHTAAKHKLAEAVRASGFRVLLTGEGADEFLLGYPHFKVDLGLSPSRKAGAVMGGVLLGTGDELDTGAFIDALGFVPAFIKAKASFAHRMRSFVEDPSAHAAPDCYQSTLDRLDLGLDRDLPPVLRSSLLWSQLSLPNYLMKIMGDGLEMAHAVEGRLPFLDLEVVELAARMPVSTRIRDLTEKHVLREAMRSDLTSTLLRREKHPFYAPPLDPNRTGPLRDFVRDSLSSKRLTAMPWVSAAKVGAWLDSRPAPSPQTDSVLCFLLSAAAIQDRLGL